MRLENHIAKLREHTRALEWALEQDNQSAIGFHASAGSVELLSILLHKLGKVTADFQINHAWFKSRRILEAKLNADFPRKEEIIAVMEEIEELRNPLCYGSPRPEEAVAEMADCFRGLKATIEEILGEKLD